jgi:genome maintenance exonuclease 1
MISRYVKNPWSFEHFELPTKNDIKWKNIDGKRHYVIDGELTGFPSVTTVLGCRGVNWIHEWRARVGAEAANEISRRATSGGTQLHFLMENTVNNFEYPELKSSGECRVIRPDIMFRWKSLSKALLPDIGVVYCTEKKLVSKKLGIGGTVDLIAVYKGKVSVIDYKTSRRKKDEDPIGYFAQCVFYAMAFEETYGIKVEQVVVAVSVEDPQINQLFVTEDFTPYLEYLVESKVMFDNGLTD